MAGTLPAADTFESVLQDGMASLATDGFNPDETVTDATQDAPRVSEEPQAPTAPVEPPPPATESVAPDASAPATEASDPLAGAEPLTYTVDGQHRTLDGVYRIPNEGIIVPEEKVSDFQRILSRADSLERIHREQTQAFDKLTQWTTKGQDGKETTISGREAIEAVKIENARGKAALAELVTMFQGSPLDYLTQDEKGGIVWNTQALNHLSTRAELSERNAADQVRSQFQGIQAELSKPPEIDVVQSAPTLVDHFATQLNVKLAAEDKQFLASMVPRFVRPTTPEDIAANPALANEPRVIDASFGQLVQREAAKRAAQATTTAATTFNAAQQNGRKAPHAPAPKKPPTPQPPVARKSNSQVWDDIFEQGKAELGSAL